MERPHRGVAAAERRERRRSALREACLDVVGSDGVEAVSADEVCRRARLSKRYFYESFADRDALLLAAYEAMAALLRDRLVDGVAGLPAGDLDTRADRLAAALVDTLSDDRRAARLFVDASRNPVLAARQSAAYDEFAEIIGTHGLGRAAAGPVEHAAAVLVVAGATEVLARRLRGYTAVTRAELVALLARMVRVLAGR